MPESVTKAGTNGDQPAKPAAAATAEPVSSQTGSAHAEVPPTITTTASAPAGPASAQRNAALALPNDELRGRVTDPSRAAKPTPTSSHLGLVGPLTWPSAFEDVIGYTLWPAQYSERLRTHGIADVLGAVFVSPATLAAKARANNVQAKVDNAGGAAVAAGACANATTAPSEWPVSEIERSIELTAAQRSALDQLKASLDSAIGSIASTCRDTADLGPTERLQAMQATLWAVHDAALLIRAPLAAFYDSLTDEQKKKFAAAPTEEANAHGMSRSEAARMCGMPASLESSMQRIERSVQTTKAQRASLDALDKKSFEMGQFLMASCLKPLPGTPAERLDAAADRLTAVLFAASNLGPAVGDFYGQLSDEQKAKLKKLR